MDAQRKQDPNLDHESPLHELFEDQLISADLVVLTKLDTASAADRAAVEALVREDIPAQVKIVAADHGRIDLDVVLGLSSASEESIHLRQRPRHGEDHEHDEHDHDALQFIVVEVGAVEREPLLAALAQLAAEQEIYRIKGFVPGKPMRLVVHGVGKRFDSYFDRPWRADEKRGTYLIWRWTCRNAPSADPGALLL